MGRVDRTWVAPVLDFHKAVQSVRLYARYWSDWVRYSKMPNAERLSLANGYPCLFDRLTETPFDSHYFYQAVWAARLISRWGIRMHVDLGSDVRFVGMLTAIVSAVTFLDVRPVKAHLPQLHSVAASALDLPLPSRSVRSLSCLHVAEHVGLGRYGDTLDPEGTKRTCQEISRVLAPDGNLLFSLPVGRPRVCFNAHRIHSPLQVLTCFKGLELIEFSAVDDRGKFREKADLDEMGQASYACGLFWFKLAKTPL